MSSATINKMLGRLSASKLSRLELAATAIVSGGPLSAQEARVNIVKSAASRAFDKHHSIDRILFYPLV
jgi:hypothetical protein